MFLSLCSLHTIAHNHMQLLMESLAETLRPKAGQHPCFSLCMSSSCHSHPRHWTSPPYFSIDECDVQRGLVTCPRATARRRPESPDARTPDHPLGQVPAGHVRCSRSQGPRTSSPLASPHCAADTQASPEQSCQSGDRAATQASAGETAGQSSAFRALGRRFQACDHMTPTDKCPPGGAPALQGTHHMHPWTLWGEASVCSRDMGTCLVTCMSCLLSDYEKIQKT